MPQRRSSLLTGKIPVNEIKSVMGYCEEPDVTCLHCTSFVEKPATEEDQCEVNTFDIQIKSFGRCDHFVRKTESDAKTTETQALP